MKIRCEVVELDPDFSDPSLVVPLPDCSVLPKSDVIYDIFDSRLGSDDWSSENAFYHGALTVLNYLDDGQSSSQEDLVDRARALVHECRYYLGE